LEVGDGRLLVVPNATGRAYVKAVLDGTSTGLVLERLADLPDPIARAVCWGAVWDAVCDGRLAPTLFVDAVICHVRAESVVGVVEQLLDRAVAAATVLAADPANGQAVVALGGAARTWLDGAAPGSDLQLLWVRLLARIARGADDLELLKDLAFGCRVIAGLEVDTDLRWQMIVALAAAGWMDDNEISTVEAADPTDEGRRQAWTARAARPDRAAKATALSQIGDGSRSLAERRAAMDGWQQAHQRDVLTGFAEGYGRMALEMWAEGEEVGITFTRAMFPHHTTDDAALADTGTLLSTDLPAGLRRIIEEERYRLQRYQRARSLDGPLIIDG
jgi:aminopeptidase N